MGGGSFEVSLLSNGEIQKTSSFPLGAVRMLQLARKQNLSMDALKQTMRAQVEDQGIDLILLE